MEDDDDLALPLARMLERANYKVVRAKAVGEALDHMVETEPDLLILDVMLPEGPDAGFLLAEELRNMGFSRPIVFLSARDAVEDRVQGLNTGGDAYLTKPFAFEELLAVLGAVARREADVKLARLERGPLEVDFAARRVVWYGSEIRLTEREFALLEFLALRPDRLFAVEELQDRLFPDITSSRYALRTYVSRLRDKLAYEIIDTVPGGYRLGLSD